MTPRLKRAQDGRPIVGYLHHGYSRHYNGSVYKWLHLFDPMLAIHRIEHPSERSCANQLRHVQARFAIVNGDIHPEYKAALRAGIPYLLFQHDVHTMRGVKDDEERRKLVNASAVLFTSEEHRDYCIERYDLEHTWLVPLKHLQADIVTKPGSPFEGRTVAFSGSILGDDARNGDFGYRAYGSILRDFVALGWTPHIWTQTCFRHQHGNELADSGCVVHAEVTQDVLYQQMSRCTIGLQSYAPYGTKASKAYAMTCRPNKLWEYLAAGIPTLGVNGGRGMAVYDGKWGVAAKGTSRRHIAEALERIDDITITTQMQRAEAIDHHMTDAREIVERMMEVSCRNTRG